MKKIIFFNLDGTIYLNNELLPFAKELFLYLQKEEIYYVFLTNNSSTSKVNYFNKLNNFGIKTSLDNIYSSIDHLLSYLAQNNLKKLYLLGTNDLKEELINAGYDLVEKYQKGAVERVVVGFDKSLTYQKLVEASFYIQDGVKVISTHLDERCPYQGGYYLPDAGSILKLLNSTAKIKDLTILGKPHKAMILNVLKEKGFKKAEALIIGDRYYTDVLAGINANIESAMILTGESKVADLEKVDYRPTYIFKDLKAVLKYLQKQEKEKR